ncbi:MAG: MoaD/ThiS family protein [Desulfurococcaceae archaeon]
MLIRINLYMDIAKKLKWSKKDVHLDKETITVRDVLESLEDLRELVLSNPDDYMILINGINMRLLKGLDTVLPDGAVIDVFPPAGGG